MPLQEPDSGHDYWLNLLSFGLFMFLSALAVILAILVVNALVRSPWPL